MDCKHIRESLEEAGLEEYPPPVREHLARCPSCESYARDWRLLRAGFRTLAAEKAPEVSLGFPARVIHRLEEAIQRRNVEAQFFERVGRRVVYATCPVTLVMLLALILPPSGPLRGSASADLLLAQPEELTAEINPIFANDSSINPGLTQAQRKAGAPKGH